MCQEQMSANISQLGGATLRNVARLTDQNPAEVPTTATSARRWLKEQIKHHRLICSPSCVLICSPSCVESRIRPDKITSPVGWAPRIE